jgi:flagellar biosynthesis GTPase FlhF
MSTAIHETPPADTQDAATAPGAARDPLAAAVASAETRTYRGRTVDELIPRIQAELGRDAIVIRRQSGLTGGFAGFFQRPYVEIEARRGSPGIDRYDEDDAAPVLPGDLGAELAAALDSSPTAALEPMTAIHPTASPPVYPPLALDAELDAAPPQPSALDEEFREFTAASLGAESFATKLAVPPAPPAPFSDALARAEAETDSQPTTKPQPPMSRSRARDAIERRLLEVGIGEEFVRELLEAATGHAMPLMPARTSLARAVQEALLQRIPTPRPLPAGGATIAVVGAGGSGKSRICTALLDAYGKRSALSAVCAVVSEGEQRGALQLSLDTHLPQPTPVGERQGRRALLAAREEGLVLLDTPAVSPADPAAVRTLAALLAELRADRVVLALPGTLGAKAANQLLESLRPLHADAIAITHADEADQLGVAVEAACTSGLAPVYMLESRRGAALVQMQPAELAERLLPGR